MKKKKKIKDGEIDIYRASLYEDMDPETLELIAEKDELNEDFITDDDGAKLVKESYKNMKSCHADIYGVHEMLLYPFVAIFLAGAGLFSYLAIKASSLIPFIIIVPIILVCVGIISYDFYKSGKKCDIYLFKVKGKNYLFFESKDFFVYFKSKKEFIWVEKCSGKVLFDDVDAEEYMRNKLGYHAMKGKMSCKKLNNGEYKIKGAQKLRWTLGVGGWSPVGRSELRLTADKLPKWLYDDGGVNGSGCTYNFRSVNDENMRVEVPRIILDECDWLGIVPPPEDSRIVYVDYEMDEAYMELRKRNMLQNEEGLSTLVNDIEK